MPSSVPARRLDEHAVDHHPDDGAPRPFLRRAERRRFAVLSLAGGVIAIGIVLAVAEVLPLLSAWPLPVLLAAVSAAFVALGRRAAARGSTAGARAWAAWAGVAVGVAVPGLVSLTGLGGALVATLLVVLLLETGLALWFRSGVHFAVVQALALGWSVLAHVFGIVPFAGVVAGLAGLWWLRSVGTARSVAATTTVVLPVAVTLVVHPLTHRDAVVDAGDVAVLVGSVALAVTVTAAVVTRARPTTALWRTVRATTLVVLVLQVLLGAVPSIAAALTPTDPWPAVGVGTAAVASAAAIAAVRPVRPGTWTLLALCAAMLAEITAAVTVGSALATAIGIGVLLAVVVVAIVRGTVSSSGQAMLWVAVLVLPVTAAVLLALPPVVVAAVLLVTGLVVAVAHTERGLGGVR